MSAGSGRGEAEEAAGPLAAPGAGGPASGCTGKVSVSAAATAAAAMPVGDNSHESGFTANPCGEDLRSNLSFMRRQSETEVAPAGAAAPGEAALPLPTPQAVVPHQAGAWSADEQQRWWQHLQVGAAAAVLTHNGSQLQHGLLYWVRTSTAHNRIG